MTPWTRHNPTRRRDARLLQSATLAAALLLAHTAHAQERDVVVTQECTRLPNDALAAWLQRLDDAPDLRVRYGANLPFAPVADVERADQLVTSGQTAYLQSDYRDAAATFKQAFDTYTQALDASPFCAACYDGVTRAGFYWATSLLLAGDKNSAREALEGLFQRYPSAEPAPGLFPPKLTRFVKDVQRGMRPGSATLDLQTTPDDATATLNGRPVPTNGPIPELTPGAYRLAVGAPGLGAQVLDLTVQSEERAALDLFNPPQRLDAACGQPAPEDLQRRVAALPDTPRYLVLLTEARSIGQEGTLAWLHDLTDRSLTGVLLLPTPPRPEHAEALADQTRDALTSPQREVLTFTDGAPRPDPDAEAAIDALLNVNTRPIDPGDTSGGTLRLALAVGTGFGYVSDGQTQQPGFANSLLLLRPDVGYALTDDLDVGLMARVQLPDLLALAHPYARYHLGRFAVRGGLHIGQVGQTIRQAAPPGAETPIEDDYTRDVTQGLFGPSLGLEARLGPVLLGLDAHAPLVPDTTLQLDLVVGGAFDL